MLSIGLKASPAGTRVRRIELISGPGGAGNGRRTTRQGSSSLKPGATVSSSAHSNYSPGGGIEAAGNAPAGRGLLEPSHVRLRAAAWSPCGNGLDQNLPLRGRSACRARQTIRAGAAPKPCAFKTRRSVKVIEIDPSTYPALSAKITTRAIPSRERQ